jgi:hypothetical protein
MATTINDVAQYLDQQAALGEQVTYGQVIERFPDIPPLTEYWDGGSDRAPKRIEK